MPRGKKSEVGETMTSQNGYSYTRTETGWRLTHHLIAEAKYGRPINRALDLVQFKDGNRRNLNPDNIILTAKRQPTANAELAKLYAQRVELDAEIALVKGELKAKLES